MKKVLLLCFFLLCACAPNPSVEQESQLDTIDQQIANMSIREKVGQLFIIRPDALDFNLDTEVISNPHVEGITDVNETFLTNYQNYPVGGFIMFAKNIDNPEQITNFISHIKEHSSTTPFIAVDEEGGDIARLANNENFDLPQFPNVGELSEQGISPYDMGQTIGQYLKTYGFNINFAPVADVNTNPNNPVIGLRSFSSDPNIVRESAKQFANGLIENQIIPVYKHFPGHGDTHQDSHAGVAFSNKTKDEMLNCEWLPFLDAKQAIMVGHIAIPEVSYSYLPATFSNKVLQDILRKELGFEGVIITDSLDMGGVTDLYEPGEAATKAILAGNDILLMPHDLKEAFDSVVKAVEDGTISTERLDQSVKRILTLKQSIN